MTKALVLSGGGSKGAFQLGVLKKWMGEYGQDYKIMTGVSVGALNIAGLSQTNYGNPKEAIDWLIDLWFEKVSTKAIYKRWYPFGRLHSLWLKSVYDSTPLVKLVHENFDYGKMLMSGRQLAVGAVCLNDGEHKFARETDPNFVDWVLASSSFPIFLNPVEIEGKLWSDGGIKNVTPLGQAIKMGADEIDVIVTSKLWTTSEWSSIKKRAIPDQIIRTMSLMNDKIMEDDIKITGLKNEIAQLTDKYKHIKVKVVMPRVNLIDNSNSLNFDPALIREMFAQGYDEADNFVVYE